MAQSSMVILLHECASERILKIVYYLTKIWTRVCLL